jgi:hypothetical protein
MKKQLLDVNVGSEAVTALVTSACIFREISPRDLLEVDRRFEGIFLMHHADSLLALLFNPEDGGDSFLPHVISLSTDYKKIDGYAVA